MWVIVMFDLPQIQRQTDAPIRYFASLLFKMAFLCFSFPFILDIAPAMRMPMCIQEEFVMLYHPKGKLESSMSPISSLGECRFFMGKNERKQKRLPSKYLFF